jgi:hypothetical protein
MTLLCLLHMKKAHFLSLTRMASLILFRFSFHEAPAYVSRSRGVSLLHEFDGKRKPCHQLLALVVLMRHFVLSILHLLLFTSGVLLFSIKTKYIYTSVVL